MPDSGIGALTEDTAPALTDFLYKVANDGTTDRKVQYKNLRKFHGASAFKSGSTQTITTSTETALTLQTEDYDTDAFHDTVTNPSRFTVPSGLDGYYLLTGEVNFLSGESVAGERQGFWKKNGTTDLKPQSASVPSSAVALIVPTGAVIVQLAATDYVELCAWQNSGGAITVQITSTQAAIYWLGPA